MQHVLSLFHNKFNGLVRLERDFFVVVFDFQK